MRLFRFWCAALPKAILFVAAACSAHSVHAQVTLTARPLAPLKTVKVPMPSNLDDFVRNREAAVALGKALFWDMQAGSDGMTACATCHWHAGADARIQNTLGLPTDNPHDATLRSAISKLSTGDFPFVKVDDPNSNDDLVSPNAVVVENRVEIVGSKGVEQRDFVRVIQASPARLAM